MSVKRDLIIVFRNGEKLTIPDTEWKTTRMSDGVFTVEDEAGLLLCAPTESVLYVYRPIVEG